MNLLRKQEMYQGLLYSVLTRCRSQWSKADRTEFNGIGDAKEESEVPKQGGKGNDWGSGKYSSDEEDLSDSKWNLELAWLIKTLEPAIQLCRRPLPAGKSKIPSFCYHSFLLDLIRQRVEQRLKETMLRLEQQLAEQRAARLKAADALEAALMSCTTETGEQLESLQAYSKQEIGKVEEKIMMIAQATLELEQRLCDDEQTARHKGFDSVEKHILGLKKRKFDKFEKDKEEEVETYRSNEEKLKEKIEKVEQRFRETTLHLEQQLAEEKAARMKSEVFSKEPPRCC